MVARRPLVRVQGNIRQLPVGDVVDPAFLSANLTALAGLTGAANKAPYFTAAGAMAVYDLTVFGRSFAAAADQAAGRTLLGLGTAATRAATTSATDTTSERLWRTNDLVKQTSANDATTGRILTLASTAGAFGLGATSANSISNPDAALTLANGMYVAVGNTFADPPYGTDTVYIDHRRGSGSAVQFAQRAQTGAGMKLRLYSGGSWGPWAELWHSKNMLALGTTPATARTALELGTAALLTASTSATDATIGRALKVGDFGIGAMGTPTLADAAVTAPGLSVYQTSSSTVDAPNSWGTLLNVRGNVSGHGFQLAKGNGNGNYYMRGSSGTAPFAWEPWQTLWHSGNFNPAAKEDRPFTIAVIGDSLSAYYPLTGESWPPMLETYLNNSGSRKFRVLNFSVGSNTCYRANTEALYGTMTASQAVVAAKPDIVIVALGGGDVLTGFGGRTLAQVKADATTLFTALRSGLPSAVICHVPIIFHDNTHGTPSTLINRQVVPFFWSKPTTGIFTGCISMERGGDAVSAAQRTRYVDLADFYSHIAGLTQVNEILSMNLFRIARVGGLGPDGLHVNELGKKMQLGYMVKSLTSAVHSVFGELAPKGFVSWEDPDTLFTSVLQSSGAGGQWVARTDVPDPVEHLTRQDDSFGLLDVELWALGYRMVVSISRTSVKTTERAFISFFGGRRGLPMYISINDQAFLPDAVATLNSKGSALLELLPLLGAINYTIRYKVGGEIYGPVTFTGTT